MCTNLVVFAERAVLELFTGTILEPTNEAPPSCVENASQEADTSTRRITRNGKVARRDWNRIFKFHCQMKVCNPALYVYDSFVSSFG